MWMAWLVHAYTASSAAFGLWGLVAAFQGQPRLSIYLMLLTLVIDSTDGALARAVDVKGRLPWFDGRRLDDICDYFTYVLLPAGFMIATGMLVHPGLAAVPVLASAYGFSRDDAKTADHMFTGFPSYWNVLAIYLYVMGSSPRVSSALVLGLSAAVFVPLRYVYPSRTRPFRPLTLAVLGVWVLVFSWLAVRPDPDPLWVRWTLLAPGYYFALSLWLNRRPGGGPEASAGPAAAG